METCFKGIVKDGQITQIVEHFTGCQEVVRYFEWNPWWIGGIIAFLVIAFIFTWSVWLYPIWNIWASRKSGAAALAEAENAEKVAIAQANARIGAAEANKKAEIIEAEAISESIKVIGNALENNPSYNRFQWIKMMEKGNNATVYVPTEANLPILEAGKRKTHDQ